MEKEIYLAFLPGNDIKIKIKDNYTYHNRTKFLYKDKITPIATGISLNDARSLVESMEGK